MGDDVSHFVQGPKPTLQHFRRHVKSGGDRSFYAFRTTFEQCQNAAKRQNFRDHPDRRNVVCIAVFTLEMRDEDFFCFVELAVNRVREALKFIGI